MNGETLKHQGALAAALHQKKMDSFWHVKAIEALISLCKSNKKFTSEDIHAKAGSPEVPNAMGALFIWAASQGMIEHVDYAKSKRKSAHSRVIKVWRCANA